jgi:hypothetical protein
MARMFNIALAVRTSSCCQKPLHTLKSTLLQHSTGLGYCHHYIRSPLIHESKSFVKIPQSGKLKIVDLFVDCIPICRSLPDPYTKLSQFRDADTRSHFLCEMDELVVGWAPLSPHFEGCITQNDQSVPGEREKLHSPFLSQRFLSEVHFYI